jgi:hypothetical protein
MSFAVPERFEKDYRLSHKTFYCPKGHQQSWRGRSDLEQERQRRISAEARAARAEDQAEVAERRRRAAKGQLTKLRNRIANGVCPWCKRSFSNVLAHVETLHPEHAEEARKAAS